MESKEFNRLDMRTSDIVSSNIEKIGNLFPNVVKEGKIDFKRLFRLGNPCRQKF